MGRRYCLPRSERRHSYCLPRRQRRHSYQPRATPWVHAPPLHCRPTACLIRRPELEQTQPSSTALPLPPGVSDLGANLIVPEARRSPGRQHAFATTFANPTRRKLRIKSTLLAPARGIGSRVTPVRLEFGPDISVECPHAPSPVVNTRNQNEQAYETGAHTRCSDGHPLHSFRAGDRCFRQ